MMVGQSVEVKAAEERSFESPLAAVASGMC